MSYPRVLQAVRLALLLVLAFQSGFSRAAAWLPYGPSGGDARSFAVDPTDHAHLYLGTANGWIYESRNEGERWERLALLGKRDDLVLDSILVDAANPKHLLVGTWVLDRVDGGIYQSVDGGHTWTVTEQMRGQSVRALASASSDPKMMVAGTLTGIYRSNDAGGHWDLISPPENREIHEVESLAIDPADPNTMYAGTWHLPWKTTDGGKTWESIKQGVIDDSDVFSIIVDPKNPQIVFASACSGIYKSENKGEKFAKVQGIPSTARRTRVLMQDPSVGSVVFAGTTEGLWRTADTGKTWARMTGPEVIVNDVFVDPSNSKRVMLATDRGGVLLSDDGGTSFAPANNGFSTRQVTAFLNDAQQPGTLYAGVVNDKELGGVFVSHDGGLAWAQQSAGLGGRDVFALAQAPDGTVIAGTGHGIFRLEGGSWVRSADGFAALGEVKKAPVRAVTATRPGSVAGLAPAERGQSAVKAPGDPAARSGAGVRKAGTRKAALGRPATVPAVPVDPAVRGLVALGEQLYAATAHGVLRSVDAGKSWQPVTALGDAEWRFAGAAGKTVAVASLRELRVSNDGGETWKEAKSPENVTHLTALAADERGVIWAGSREGVYLSSDAGASWQTLGNLYVRDVDGMYFDRASGQVFVTSNGGSTLVFAVQTADRKVRFWDAGWTLRFVRPVGDHLLGATLFDGVVIEPRMVESKQVATQ